MAVEQDPDRQGLVKRTRSSIRPLLDPHATHDQRRAALVPAVGTVAVIGGGAFGIAEGVATFAAHNVDLANAVAPYADSMMVWGARGLTFPVLMRALSSRSKAELEANRQGTVGVAFLASVGAGSATVAAVAGGLTHVMSATTVAATGHVAADLAGVAVGAAAAAKLFGLRRAKPEKRAASLEE